MNDSVNRLSGDTRYAGFWIRVVACLIDSGILYATNFIVILLLAHTPQMSLTVQIFGFLIGIIYYVAFNSSKHMGTPGKMAMGIAITDENGQRMTMPRALLRYFAVILSSMILGIGLIMVAFTDRKRGLHDMLCNTYVVFKNSLK